MSGMARYQEFNVLKRNSTQSTFKKVVSTSHILNNNILQGLLERLNTTTDVNLHIKLFTALSTYILDDTDTNVNVIIKCSALYDRIQDVLTKGLPRKATSALNFLSALLSIDVDEDATTQRKALALYAKNMTRISGCLGVMADLFANSMMVDKYPYHDTWKALCQCIAIACSDSEINQNYCSHLIATCIQKCSQTNIDTFIVLQSLVENHKQNIQIFLDFNGTSIFTRELLHYDKCLQLLTAVMLYSDASSILRDTNVPNDFRDFLRLYGADSQIGQKAMIILNHIESRAHGSDYHTSHNENNEEQPQIQQKIECSIDITRRNVDNLDDTKLLMQNVMKEVFNHKQNELKHLKKTASNVEVTDLIRGASAMNLNSRISQTHLNTLNRSKRPFHHRQQIRLKHDVTNELSFTFLQDYYKNRLSKRHFNITKNKTRNLNIKNQSNTESHKTQSLSIIERDLSDCFETLPCEKPTPVDLKDFRPTISSTPKHERNRSKQMYNSKMTTFRPSTTIQSHMTQYRTNRVHKRREKLIAPKTDKDLRNRSLSSRFFGAINESYTTIVKTVTNIFKKKEDTDSSKDKSRSHSSRHGNRSCSYSFLKYMHKRDAVLNNKLLNNGKYSDNSKLSVGTKSCETCNDTVILKHKLVHDKHLKHTLKKLKLGINLYGCDFKKISRTMWPRESYMTPVVLYNLYRKLLLK